jgi:phosphoribosylformimino-5-aminoimidazole carboxamide ribotide isomerase
MKLLPVIDLKQGIVVRGVAGRREQYRPLVSGLTSSCAPVDVAKAFRDHLGCDEIYLADLDAIARKPPAFSTYAAIQAAGLQLWVDAGVCDVEDAARVNDAGIHRLVVGLETVEGPKALARIVDRCGPNRVVFSLDLRDGRPLARSSWPVAAEPETIAALAVAVGLERMIVLDLADVGTARGNRTLALCRRLHVSFPKVELIAGGGVRDLADLRSLQEGGVSRALVASALHDGRITRGDIARL